MFRPFLISSLVLVLATASAKAGKTELPFTFAPQPGAWEREFRMIATVSIDGQPGQTTSVRTLRRQEVKPEGEGWAITSIPGEVEIDGVESPLDRALQQILLSQQFTYHLDAQGQLLSVEGFDRLSQEVDDKIPADSRQAVQQVVNAETQRWRLANQWDAELAWLYGKTLVMATEYTQEKRLDPPDGPAMNFKQVSTPIFGPGQESILVEFSSTATPTEDADLRQLHSLLVTEKGERQIAIDSGLPLEETSTRKVKLSILGPEGLITQLREETRHIRYRPLEE